MHRFVVLSLALVLGSATWAAKEEHPPIKMPKNFEGLKSLVGTWEAVTVGDPKNEKFTVVYELTSGGSALVERLFLGSPHEMVSVYHADGDKVVMTHYCMLGNQPKLALKNSDAKNWSFELKGKEGLKSKSEPHMHALKLTQIDSNHVKQEWTSWEKGKKKETSVFTLTRKI